MGLDVAYILKLYYLQFIIVFIKLKKIIAFFLSLLKKGAKLFVII